MAGSISPEDVRQAYLLLLGREPESEEAVRGHIASYKDVSSLVAAMLKSSEYAQKSPSWVQGVAQIYNQPRQRVDLYPTVEQADLMFRRIQEQWMSLGETDPHWSVLTHDDYRASSIQKNKEAFYQSGRETITLLETFSDRCDLPFPRGTCLELGCGVGRSTQFLAERFDRVIGLDVSSGNLAHCRDHLESQGVTNVDLIQIKSMEDFEALPRFDFFFSFIVLQHNPPPIQRAMLEAILQRVKPGGACIFQTPGIMASGYEFNIEHYLNSPELMMEMHPTPMHVVLDLLAQARFQIREIMPDNWSGAPGSFTYFATKNNVR